MSANRKPGNSGSQYHFPYSPPVERPSLVLESYHAARIGAMPVALNNFGEMRLSKSGGKSRFIQKRVLEGVMLSFGHSCFSGLNCKDVEETDAQYPHPCPH